MKLSYKKSFILITCKWFWCCVAQATTSWYLVSRSGEGWESTTELWGVSERKPAIGTPAWVWNSVVQGTPRGMGAASREESLSWAPFYRSCPGRLRGVRTFTTHPIICLGSITRQVRDCCCRVRCCPELGVCSCARVCVCVFGLSSSCWLGYGWNTPAHPMPHPTNTHRHPQWNFGSESETVQPRQHIKKQRYYFANKGPSSQSYGFSSSHACMDVRVEL